MAGRAVNTPFGRSQRHENKVNFFLTALSLASEQSHSVPGLANVAKRASPAVNGSRNVPDLANFLCSHAALCIGRDRLAVVPAGPVRGRGPFGDGVGVRARSLELPGSPRKARGRASHSFGGRIVALERLPAVDGQHLAQDVARALAAEEEDGFGDVVAVGDAAGWDPRQHCLLIEPAAL
jgi:hypothetical protein